MPQPPAHHRNRPQTDTHQPVGAAQGLSPSCWLSPVRPTNQPTNADGSVTCHPIPVVPRPWSAIVCPSVWCRCRAVSKGSPSACPPGARSVPRPRRQGRVHRHGHNHSTTARPRNRTHPLPRRRTRTGRRVATPDGPWAGRHRTAQPTPPPHTRRGTASLDLRAQGRRQAQ